MEVTPEGDLFRPCFISLSEQQVFLLGWGSPLKCSADIQGKGIVVVSNFTHTDVVSWFTPPHPAPPPHSSCM